MTKAIKYVFFTMIVLLMALDNARATSSRQIPISVHSLEPIGQIGGSFKALVAQDGYVYAAIGPRLTVLDVSDATHPTLMGQTGILPIDIQSLAIQGEVVYAAAGVDGLSIFDVSNPSQPVKIGSLEIAGFATSVAITGGYAFVTTDMSLQIVDVMQPTTPVIVGSYPVIARDVAFSGNTMFIALENKISLVNVSDPTNPTLILDYGVGADEIEIDGNVVYVGKLSSVWGAAGPRYYGVLRILDISGLPAITETFFSGDNYLNGLPQLRDMKLLGHQLYGYDSNFDRATGPRSLVFRKMDVSDPISPSTNYVSLYSVTRYDWYWGDVAVNKQHIYMATKDTLHIFNADTSVEVGQYTSWSADQVDVENGVAYIAARSAGLLTINVSNPEFPAFLDAYTTTTGTGETQLARISAMAIYGPYIYAQVTASGLGPSRMDILDISDNNNITRVATAENYIFPKQIHNGYGYYFYQGNGGIQLRAIDLGNPTQPIQTLGWQATTIANPQLSLVGNYAYVAGIYEGLHIINVADPQNFLHIKRLAGPIPAFLQASTENALYIFTNQALKIFDVSDPENPIESSNTQLMNLTGLTAMKESNNDIYLIQNETQLLPFTATIRAFHTNGLYSVANEVTYYKRSGGSFTSIDVVGDLVYVTSADDGLLILRHIVNNPSLSKKIYLPFIDN